MKRFWQRMLCIFGAFALCAGCLAAVSSCDREEDVAPKEDPFAPVVQDPVTTPKREKGFRATLNNDKTGYILTEYKGESKQVQVPAVYRGLPVTEIGEGAFSDHNTMEEISIPSSVTKINDKAFFSCDHLKKVSLPKSLTYIGEYAFEGCSQLIEFHVPEGVTYIGEGAFSSCYFLEKISIPDSLTEVGAGVFSSCKKLESQTYGGGAYLGNEKNPYLLLYGFDPAAEEVVLHEDTGVIAEAAFRSHTALRRVTIAGEVTKIPADAFLYCEGLERIFVGINVDRIDVSAFLDCSSLREIEVSPLNTAYRSAGNCLIETYSRTLVLGGADAVIPDDGSVREIGAYAFYNRQGLTRLVIPEPVRVLGAYSFSKCTNLYELILPRSLVEIEEFAFDKRTKLDYVYYEGSAEEWSLVTVGGTVGFGSLATLCCYAEERPAEIGAYWRYVDGVPVRWTFLGDA